MMTTNISQIQSWIKECLFSQRKSKKTVLVSSPPLINSSNGLKLRDLRATHSEIRKMSDLCRFDLKNKLKCVKFQFRCALIINVWWNHCVGSLINLLIVNIFFESTDLLDCWIFAHYAVRLNICKHASKFRDWEEYAKKKKKKSIINYSVNEFQFWLKIIDLLLAVQLSIQLFPFIGHL